jgi:hypothetical protein
MWTLSPTAKAEFTSTAIRNYETFTFYVVESHTHILKWTQKYTGDLDQTTRLTVHTILFSSN